MGTGDIKLLFACQDCKKQMPMDEAMKFYDGPADDGHCNKCAQLYCQNDGCYRRLYTLQNDMWHPPEMVTKGNYAWFVCPYCKSQNELILSGGHYSIVDVDPPTESH